MKKEFLYLFVLLMMCSSCSSGMRLFASGKSKTELDEQKQLELLQDSIIEYGKRFMRTPYRYGGTTPRGFDCSGYTSYVFKNFGYDLPRSSRDQAQYVTSVKRNDVIKGDLVFFEGRRRNGVVGHVGIVTENEGNGQFRFLHASVSSGVIISSSQEAYYAPRYLRAGRVINASAAQAFQENIANKTITKATTADVAPECGSVLSEALYHRVKRGESLSKIAKEYDISVAKIQQLNNLRGTRIRMGQRLLIYEAVPKPNVTLNHGGQYIDRGVIDAPELQLIDPVQTDTVVQEVDEDRANTAVMQDKYHRVKSGETLSGIAKRYGLTVNRLKAMNNLRSNNIRVGQRLLVGKEEQ